MTKQMPAATSHVYLTAGQDQATELHVDQGAPVRDHSERRRRPHNPLDLMTAALATCTAICTRSFLERAGDPGDVDVMVSLDLGSPPWLHRRVEICRQLSREDTRLLAAALDDTDLAAALRTSFRIRTVVTFTGADR